MSNLNNSTTLNDTITVSKQLGTVITLNTDNSYVDKDIILTMNVQSGSAVTPATTITANPTIALSQGMITATASATSSITPTVSAGWIGSGSAGTVTIEGFNSVSPASLNIPLNFTDTLDSNGGTIRTLQIGSYSTVAVSAKTIVENGIYSASTDGVDGYSVVTVSFPIATTAQVMSHLGIA